VNGVNLTNRFYLNDNKALDKEIDAIPHVELNSVVDHWEKHLSIHA